MRSLKRNSILLLLLLIAVQIYGQQDLLKRRVSVQFNNESISEALNKLGIATNCDIYYRPSDLPAERTVKASYVDEEVGTIIKEIWGDDRLILRAGNADISIKPQPQREVKIKKGNLKGRITDEKGTPIPFATIALQGTNKGVISDEDGKFQIKQISAGTRQFSVSSMGFQKKEVVVDILPDQIVSTKIEMRVSTGELEEVVVFGKSQEQLKMEEPIKVEVINTKKLQTKSLSLPQVINQSPGVKIRQSGGVGSSTIINVNGLQGNAIRFFRDGIPLDYLGRAFDLNLIPVDQLDNIEIYKGVLPAELGADALGGALNLTSRKDFRNNLDLA
ncbi:MAG: TonB-dependent receptor, partial [Bacteroidota bacterium]